MSLPSELPQEATSWWSRPSGGREVLRVAMPLVISSLSWTVMTFVDRIFLSWVSGDLMAASFSASVVWFAILCLPLGICSYVSTFVSQYHGDQQPMRIGAATWQGVWVALVSILWIAAFVPIAPGLFALGDHPQEFIEIESLYFRILCVGAPGMLVGQALSSFYSGRGQTWVVMVVDSLVTIVNLVLDYAWIFGVAGFPAWGIAGAGWATVVSLWLKAAIYLVLILQKEHRWEYNTLGGMRWDRELFGRLIYYGGPSGGQMLLDVSGFTAFVILVGKIGQFEVQASTMAFSINSVSFMPVWGLGMAVSVLVGQRLGENRDDLAARATWTAFIFGLGYMGFVAALYVFTPWLFIDPFFARENFSPLEQEAVRTMAINLLLFVAAYTLGDASMMIFVCAVKGAGDTAYVLRVSIVMAVVLTVGSWVAVDLLGVGIYGCWTFLTLWIFAMGGAFFWRFMSGQWRSMRVIEQRTRGPQAVEGEAPPLVPETVEV